MSKKRATAVFGILVLAILGYVAWTCWPRSAVVEWHHRISEDRKSVVEDYLSQNPPLRTPLTWERLWISITNPYDLPRDKVLVTLMKYSDGNEFIQINYPESMVSYPESMVSIRCLEDGRWEEVDPSAITSEDAVLYIGRMFEKRNK